VVWPLTFLACAFEFRSALFVRNNPGAGVREEGEATVAMTGLGGEKNRALNLGGVWWHVGGRFF